MQSLISSIYSVIGSANWSTIIGVPTYPSDFAEPSAAPFLRVSILPGRSNRRSYDGVKQVSGLIIVTIFYKVGEGQIYAATTADKLDQLLQDTVINNNSVQIGESSLQYKGVDPNDKTLARADYSVPFDYFGEI